VYNVSAHRIEFLSCPTLILPLGRKMPRNIQRTQVCYKIQMITVSEQTDRSDRVHGPQTLT
jgi:hypothetical protein